MIEPCAGFPSFSVIAVPRQPAIGFEQFRHMHQITSHEIGIALGEIIVETDCAIIAVK